MSNYSSTEPNWPIWANYHWNNYVLTTTCWPPVTSPWESLSLLWQWCGRLGCSGWRWRSRRQRGANRFLQQELFERSLLPTQWPKCPKCRCRLRSPRMRPRKIQTLVGSVHFSRRVGRCRNGCLGVMVVPLDQELGLEAHQQTSQEVMQLGCLLAVFVPFDTATVLLQRLTGVQLSAATIWNWTQSAGQKAMKHLQLELELLTSGIEPTEEKRSPILNQMPLIVGADGVMVPMRAQEKTPKGKIIWREVKVAILARSCCL